MVKISLALIKALYCINIPVQANITLMVLYGGAKILVEDILFTPTA